MKDKGLSVVSVRKNKRELILSLASSPYYHISWLQKALNNPEWIERQIDKDVQNIRHTV